VTFRFNDVLWLWALLFVPVLTALAVLAARSRRRALARFADSDLVTRLTASVHVGARRWKQGLQIAAVGLLAFALARPQFGSRVETVRNVGQDIVVAVDLSQSMMAEDVTPNRLERARLAIYRLMSRLDGDRIGLVAFAADAFIQSPLTSDYRAAGMFLGAMTPELMPIQGTDLGAALRVSLDALEKGARESRVLILVTDAEDHENDYEQEFERIRELGVEVFVVVIGSNDGVPIPVIDERGNRQGFLRDDEGNVVTTRVGEEALQNLARGAGATLIRAGAGGTEFDDFVDQLARAEGEELDSRQVTLFEEQYQIFLGLALLMLMAEGLISDRRHTERRWAGRFE
jgi:Ca-activated chloride channel family protein